MGNYLCNKGKEVSVINTYYVTAYDLLPVQTYQGENVSFQLISPEEFKEKHKNKKENEVFIFIKESFYEYEKLLKTRHVEYEDVAKALVDVGVRFNGISRIANRTIELAGYETNEEVVKRVLDVIQTLQESLQIEKENI
jgi:hypothetical protein